jgi:hypothetical protein
LIFAVIGCTAVAACNGGTSIGPAPSGGSPTGTSPTGTSPSASAPGTAAPVVQPSPGKGAPPPSNAPTESATASPAPTPVGQTPVPVSTGGALPAGKYIYVTNHGPFGAGSVNQSSVTVYPITASGDATPIATLQGPATNLEAIQFVAVDPAGKIYVSSSQQGYRSGTVTEYTSPYGNVAPVATISGLFAPEGLALDSKNNLYVGQIDGLYVYAPGASGNDPAPAYRITGGTGDNQIYNAYEVFIGQTGSVDIALQNQVEVFNPNPTSNSALAQNIFGEATTLFYVLGTASDSSGNVYATNQSINTITEFSSTANNPNGTSETGPEPSGTITGTAFDDPWGLFIDPSNNAYVVNRGNNSVLIFSSSAFSSGIPTTTISGPDTGLNNPIGVYVR